MPTTTSEIEPLCPVTAGLLGEVVLYAPVYKVAIQHILKWLSLTLRTNK